MFVGLECSWDCIPDRGHVALPALAAAPGVDHSPVRCCLSCSRPSCPYVRRDALGPVCTVRIFSEGDLCHLHLWLRHTRWIIVLLASWLCFHFYWFSVFSFLVCSFCVCVCAFLPIIWKVNASAQSFLVVAFINFNNITTSSLTLLTLDCLLTPLWKGRRLIHLHISQISPPPSDISTIHLFRTSNGYLHTW